MTKTQITVRVSPDTLAAIDAAVKASGTTRNHIIDAWLTESATRHAPERRRSIEEMLLSAAQGVANAVAAQPDGMTTWQNQVVNSIDRIITAARVMAGIDE